MWLLYSIHTKSYSIHGVYVYAVHGMVAFYMRDNGKIFNQLLGAGLMRSFVVLVFVKGKVCVVEVF